MPTRKQFCQSCLAMVLAGLNCRRPLGGLAGLGAPVLFAKERDDVTKDTGEGKERPIIAYCGLQCSDCPAYIATQKNDDALRAETAKKWSAMFKSDIKPADINCDGCPTASQRLFSYCATCEIRKCARGKKLATCASCPEYSCQKLDEFLAQAPEARKVLEKLRKG